MNIASVQQLRELQLRLDVRASFYRWSHLALGFEQAAHQKFLINELIMVTKGQTDRLIVMMPPGSAKSYYCSVAYPPWYLAQHRGQTILACSYSYNLIEGFGRRCRNLVDIHHQLLGYNLARDSKAAGEWETDNDGRYFCAGTNAGIAGHRANLGIIDDPIGSWEDANSKLYRDKQWEWYWQDFIPRLKPGAARVIVCNRRHEDDLVGRLLDPRRDPTEASRWRVISIPMLAKEGDVLGRQVGERLWPEWFTPAMVEEAQKNQKAWSGMYQQEPTPESGDFFKRNWIVTYQAEELPKNLRIYVTSDHAVSEEKGAHKTCFTPFGVDEDDHIWILPDNFWKVASPGECVEEMLNMVERRRPICWVAEKGHISKSLWPLIQKRMKERGIYFVMNEKTPVRNKRARAGSIAGRMQMLHVHFPAFAAWWPDALFEMMSFTGNGDDKSDDFCDTLSHIGGMLDETTKASKPKHDLEESLTVKPQLNWQWLHEQKAAQTKGTQNVDDR